MLSSKTKIVNSRISLVSIEARSEFEAVFFSVKSSSTITSSPSYSPLLPRNAHHSLQFRWQPIQLLSISIIVKRFWENQANIDNRHQNPPMTAVQTRKYLSPLPSHLSHYLHYVDKPADRFLRLDSHQTVVSLA